MKKEANYSIIENKINSIFLETNNTLSLNKPSHEEILYLTQLSNILGIKNFLFKKIAHKFKAHFLMKGYFKNEKNLKEYFSSRKSQ